VLWRGGHTTVALLVLVVMAALFFAPLVWHDQIFYLGDACFHFYPGYVFYREALLRGSLPLWNPYTGCGEPFLADIERGVLYPLNLIYLLCPAVTTAMVVSVAIHVVLAGLGTYALARAWRVSFTGALLAGVVYAFSGYLITKVQFPSALGSAAWFPVALTSLVLWTRDRSFGAFLRMAIALCMQFLAGFPESFTYSIAALGVYAVFASVYEGRTRRRWSALLAPVFGLVGAGILAGLLSMAQLLPTWEALRLSERAGGVDPKTELVSLHPLTLVSFLIPSIYGVQGPFSVPWGTYWSPSCLEYSISALYLGILPVTVLLTALIYRGIAGCASQEGAIPAADAVPYRVPFLITVAAFFFTYSMGTYTPLFGTVRCVVPLFRQFVSPAKSLLCVVLPLSCLAGIALDGLCLRAEHAVGATAPWRRWVLRWGPCSCFALLTVFIAACLMNGGALGRVVMERVFNLNSVDPRFAHWIPWDVLARDGAKLAVVGLACSLLLQIHVHRPRARAVTAVLIVLTACADLLDANRYLLHPGPAALFRERTATFDKLQPEGRLTRFFMYKHVLQDDVREMMKLLPAGQEVHDLLGKQVAHGYAEVSTALARIGRHAFYLSLPIIDKAFNAYPIGVLSPENVIQLLGVALHSSVPLPMRERVLGMFNCDRIVLFPDIHELFSSGSAEATRLTILPNSMPRAYVVGGVEVLRDDQAVLRAIAFEPFDPLKVALVDQRTAGDQYLGDLQPGTVLHHIRRLEYVINGLEIELISQGEGILVISETYYPGWKATVNGKEVPLLNVNLAFRGVRVPSGESLVRMVYRPASVRLGIVISLATIIGVLLVGFLRRGFRNRSRGA